MPQLNFKNLIIFKKLEQKDKENQNLKKIKEDAVADFKFCLSLLKAEKEKIAKYEREICHLTNENQNLKIRAAVAFDELTPRPSFGEVIILQKK